MIPLHIPVLLAETMEYMQIKKGGIYCDLTLGDGSFSKAILKRGAKVFAFDKDERQIKRAKTTLKSFGKNIKYFQEDFADFRSALAMEKISKVDGIIADIGVSTEQILNGEFGFSYQKNGPIDMRMDRNKTFSALELLTKYPEDILIEIFKKYSNEPKAKKIAHQIYIDRKTLQTTFQLNSSIEKITRSVKSKSRIYQAIRIVVNGELESLKTLLDDCAYGLKQNGKVAIISYHSLEDRIVKHGFSFGAKSCVCPTEFDRCLCNKKAVLKILTKKPILPSKAEILNNPKSRSAKLRVAQRI